MVKFNANATETRAIHQIVERAITLKLVGSASKSVIQDLMMDLDATHSNGCPLNFEKLLAFDDNNFAHDIIGISRSISRDTGKLQNFFLPRCAKPTPCGKEDSAV